jgi:hypothetical protein
MNDHGSKEVKMMAEETEVRGEKPVAVEISPPQIPHRLACDRKYVSGLRG